jgi:hypothetical protein
MNAATMVTDLSTGSGWYFGGYLYGLEPLTLPNPGVTNDDSVPPVPDTRSRQDYTDACRRILRRAPAGAGEPTDELYWFRWITGHQVSFVIWRLMAQTLHGMRAGRIAQPAAVRALCHHVYGYTAMLLYTSSCPRQIYQDLIRPSMYRQHRGFSGGWAPDYQSVRGVFRGQSLDSVDSRMAGELDHAVRLCQTVHEGVGAKLVPDGRSLLRTSAASRRALDVRLPDIRLLGALFDSYFMTLRAAVSTPDIVAQVLRRLDAVTHDVAMNGLHPSGGARDRPPQLRIPAVLDLESELATVCFDVATSAIALVTGEHGPDSPVRLSRTNGVA